MGFKLDLERERERERETSGIFKDMLREYEAPEEQSPRATATGFGR